MLLWLKARDCKDKPFLHCLINLDTHKIVGQFFLAKNNKFKHPQKHCTDLKKNLPSHVAT